MTATNAAMNQRDLAVRTGRPGLAGRAGHRVGNVLKGAAGLLVLVGVWEVLRAVDVLPRSAVPSTLSVWQAIRDGFADGSLAQATLYTVQAWAAGLGLAVLVGLPLGVLIGLSSWAHAATRNVIDFFRPIPSVAFVPVALVFLGFEMRMEVVLILVGAVWPVLYNTRYGVQDVDPLLLDTGRALHLGPVARVVRIRLVAATPAILTGVRTAATIALILAVSAEALAVPQGLGYVIAQAATVGSTAAAYASIVITGVLGVLINLVVTAARARIVGWSLRAAERGE